MFIDKSPPAMYIVLYRTICIAGGNLMKESNVGLDLMIIANIIRRDVEKTIVKTISKSNEVEHLSGQNGLIINFLYQNQGKDVCQRDIEEFFSLARSTVSTNLRLMEKKGLIIRKKMESDTRQKKVMLTEKSIQIEENNEELIKSVNERFNKVLNPDEILMLAEMLERLKKEFDS
jgi:DNA-binding MarR family transcriptional regulator